ncbi:hypothetical protein TWF718_007492 [Orbilia javanica]|uniref:Nucleoside phosphorylase domain-containing protein n=1 Tax=Orbilia javanica TaxID=47235 RepID=A0AAN8RDA9_9PEZI
MQNPQSLPKSAYTIAWIAALPTELTAALSVLDQIHRDPQDLHRNDKNKYHLGSIHDHNIVITCLPAGGYGTVNAAVVAAQVQLSFPSVELYLLVGIAGGIPTLRDIRLGDVVVSKPEGSFNGVVQYDFGKTVQDGSFKRFGNLDKPSRKLLAAIASLEAKVAQSGRKVEEHLRETYTKYPNLVGEYGHPGTQHDVLYKAEYKHADEQAECDLCSKSEVVIRKNRDSTAPVVHYGLVASGNQVVKHGVTRDRIGQDIGAICFEMEAAGLMDNFQCLVIRVPTYHSPTLKASERIFDIPGILHPRFSGRQKYLDRVEAIFRGNTSKQGTIVSVFGMPGLGKSQMCLKYATDHRDDYDYAFYASASTAEHWLESCDNIIRRLKLPEADLQDQSQRVAALRAWLAGTPNWILIIDDAWSCAVNAVRNILPSGFSGNILLSTRDKFIAEDFSGEEGCIALKEMDADEGRELILKVYNQRNATRNQQNNQSDVCRDIGTLAEMINQELGGLPLALEQGMTCAKQRCWRLDAFLENLQENKQSIMQDPTQTNPHHANITTTLGIALEGLKSHHVALLNIMMMMRPQGLPMGILIDGGPYIESIALNEEGKRGARGRKRWIQRFINRLSGKSRHQKSMSSQLTLQSTEISSVPDVTDEASIKETDTNETFKLMRRALGSEAELSVAIVEMEKSSLIRRGDDGEIWMHDLVREVLLGGLGEQKRKDYLLYAIKIVKWAFPNVDSSSRRPQLEKCRLYLPHAMEVYNLMKSYGLNNADRIHVAELMGQYIADNVGLDDAVNFLDEAVEYRRNVLGVDDEAVVAAWNLAEVYNRKAEPENALAVLQQMLDSVEDLEKKGSLGRVSEYEKFDLLRGIAYMHGNLGRYEEATGKFTDLIAEIEATKPFPHKDLILCEALRTTGRSYYRRGDAAKALEYYEKALEHAKKRSLLEVEFRLERNLNYDIAGALKYLGQTERALEHCQRSLEAGREACGDGHFNTVVQAEVMGYIYKDKGEYARALECFEQVIPAYERIYGKDHVYTKKVIDDAERIRSMT